MYNPGNVVSDHIKWWNNIASPLLKQMEAAAEEKERRVREALSQIADLHNRFCPVNGLSEEV
jgi:hypothetical protein